jgi:glycerol uptake facilitator-like aquaporin
MNPARSLAPALVSGTWQDQWIYLVAPVIGAAAGALVYQFVRGRPQADCLRTTPSKG